MDIGTIFAKIKVILDIEEKIEIISPQMEGRENVRSCLYESRF